MSKTSSAVTVKLLFVAMIVTGVTTAAATSVLVRDPNPIVAAEGSLTGATDLTVDEQRLTYDGVNVTGVTVTVNNTAVGNHTGIVHLAVKNGSTTIESTTIGETTFAGGSTTDVTVSLSTSYSVAELDRVEVTIERTD